jgi:hypothetical protein
MRWGHHPAPFSLETSSVASPYNASRASDAIMKGKHQKSSGIPLCRICSSLPRLECLPFLRRRDPGLFGSSALRGPQTVKRDERALATGQKSQSARAVLGRLIGRLLHGTLSAQAFRHDATRRRWGKTGWPEHHRILRVTVVRLPTERRRKAPIDFLLAASRLRHRLYRALHSLMPVRCRPRCL